MTDFFICLIESMLDTDLNGEEQIRNLFLFTMLLPSKHVSARSKPRRANIWVLSLCDVKQKEHKNSHKKQTNRTEKFSKEKPWSH